MELAGNPPISRAGFCALRLAQRLLNPVPAGNCKLQNLRQYYRPARTRRAHGAGRRSGEEEAGEVREQFKQAEAETREYESTAAALEKKRD